MPGRGSYGPGGKWIHDRAKRIMEKGDVQDRYGEDDGKSVAYAIATQQAHKMGKTPKKKGGYGTSEGRSEAKSKYDKPREEYRKTASVPGQDLRTPMTGSPKFPTRDSTAFSNKLLRQSQKVGTPGGSSGMSIDQLTPNMGTSKGKLPMLKGAEMNDERLKSDPLIQHLQKNAQALTTNVGDGPPTEPVFPTEEVAEKAIDERDRVLKELFKNRGKSRKSLPDVIS
jgi:hypothetical protein